MAANHFDQICVDTIRFLAVDMKHHPDNPQCADRDRFALSAGRGPALLYGVLESIS